VHEPDNPVITFETQRGRLFGLAYRMLGSRADAEDLVQETYVRWHQTDRGIIENPEAWLVTTTTRLAICGGSRPSARRMSVHGCLSRS
jgi:RNA polymerase sigma-70 factor (ECF subfamily)